MSDNHEQTRMLSVGGLAKRWKVSRERITALINTGHLAAFRLPGAGRFGETIRIQLAVIEAIEQQWKINPQDVALQPNRKANGRRGTFKHFPRLTASAATDAECH